jgi:hypothetical protein
MTRVRSVVVLSVWLLAAAMPGAARAESGDDALPFLNCGEIARSNHSWQFGPNAWVQYIVETSRSIDLCPLEVEAEAFVNGVPNSGTSNRAVYTASVMRQVPVPRWGNWTTSGKHWFIWLFVSCVRQRQPLPLLVYAGVVTVLALCASSYFGSKPRLLLPAFPLLLPLARALARPRTPRSVLVTGTVAVASAIYGAFWLNGSGPP